MKRSGVVLRRALASSAVALLATLSACGSGPSESAGSPEGSSEPSSSPSSQASPSASGGAQAVGAADGKCGGGEFETQVVRAASGVRVTVPADWRVRSTKAGTVIRFSLPSGADGDGYLLVQPSKQTLAQVVAEAQKSTRASAKVASESRPRLPGFQAALATDFSYDGGEAFSVNVVAVGGGLRVLANLAGDRDDATQAAALSCLTSLARTS